MKEIPYIAIGNEELAEALTVNEGDIVSITVDGTRHEGAVTFGDRIVDGERIKCNTIGAITITDGRVILVAVSGRLLSGVTLIERKYTQEYITSLEARIVELEAALDKAAHEMYEETGSCPSDMFDWEHPNTCFRECDKYEKPDEAWKCWRLWLMCPAPPEE